MGCDRVQTLKRKQNCSIRPSRTGSFVVVNYIGHWLPVGTEGTRDQMLGTGQIKADRKVHGVINIAESEKGL